MVVRADCHSVELHDRHVGRANLIRMASIAVTAFSGLAAIGGGIGVLFNGLGNPQEQLANTPFHDFLIPGLLLTFVVGGSMVAATFSLLRRKTWAGKAGMIAGAIMLGWIAIEAMMISGGRGLQISVFLFALITVLLGWRMDRESRSGEPSQSGARP